MFKRGWTWPMIGLMILAFVNELKAVNPPSVVGDSSNIILWLSPDSGVFNSGGTEATVGQDVAEWRDISGNGFIFTNSFTARRPVLSTFNNQRYLNFTPGDFFENTIIKDSINGLDEFSIFITIKSDLTNTDNGFMDSENPNGTDDKICLRYDSRGANTGRVNLLKTGMNGNQANNQVETQSNTQTTNVQVLTLVWKDGERLKVFIDGVLNDSSNSTVAGPLAGIQKIILGKGPKNTSGGLGGGSGWDGLIGEVLFYNKQYSADTIQQVASAITAVQSIKSGSWTDTTVWDCSCVPPYQVDVTISSGHSVTLDSSVSLKSLTLNTGGQLDVTSNNYNIDLLKHLNVVGALNIRNGTVSFSGDEPSLITGTFSLYRLEINKTGSTVQAQSGTVSITDRLLVNTGTLDANSRMTLVSNSSKTAYLGQVGGTIIGNLNVQRYVDGLNSSVGYRHYSLPIENGSIDDIQYHATNHPGGIYTWGFTGSNIPSNSGFISTYSFSESSAVGGNNFDNGWTAATSSANTLGPSNAMTFYCGGPSYSAYNIEVSGRPNQGTITLNNLSYSSTNSAIGGGWHLIGNPYAAAIDWSQVVASSSGLDATAYVYSETSGGYIASSLLPTANNIPSFQGFFIHVNNATNSIVFEESDKTSNDPSFVRSNSVLNRLRLKLENASNGLYVPAALDLNEKASRAVDTRYDAYLLNNHRGFPKLFFESSDSVKLQVQALNEQVLSDTVFLHVTNFTHDSLILSFEELPELNGCLRIVDMKTGELIPLRKGKEYKFLHDNTFQSKRFALYTTDHMIDIQKTDLSCFESFDGALEVNVKSLTQPWYLLKNLEDTVHLGIFSQEVVGQLGSGYYTIHYGSNDGCGVNHEVIVINQPAKVTADFDVFSEVLPNEDIGITNNSLGSDQFEWDFAGFGRSTASEPLFQFDEEGDYTIKLISFNSNLCADSLSKRVQVKSFGPGPTSIEESNQSKTSVLFLSDGILRINPAFSAKGQIEIYNVSGQVLEEVTYEMNSGTWSTLDISFLKQQVLIVVLTDLSKGSSERAKVFHR